MPVQITINGGDAAEAIREFKSLSSAFTGGDASVQVAAATEAPQAPVQPAPTAQASYPQTSQTAPQAPVYGQAHTPAYQPPQAPVQPAPQPPTGVPTSAPVYTLDQLGVAAQPLLDAGRGPELLGWLSQYGVQALTQLKPQHYGDFATFLRSLGARI